MKAFVVVFFCLTAASFASALLCSCNDQSYLSDCRHANPPWTCKTKEGQGKCLTQRKLLSDGTVQRRERCVNLTFNPTLCHGVFNSEKNVYECCSDGDRCNQGLLALLPFEISPSSSSEVPTPSPSVAAKPTPLVPGPLLCACSDPRTCPRQTCQTSYKCFREETFLSDGRHLGTRLGCLDNSNIVNFDKINICSPVHDTATSRFRCCDGANYCNRDLIVPFPSPRPQDSPTTTTDEQASGGLKEDDLFFILSVVVVLVTMVAVLSILIILAVICLRYHRDKAKVASLAHLQKENKKHSHTYVHTTNIYPDRTPYSV